ncbi:hypothetical protein ACIBJI_30985 [Nocardia sp. NPDC050408]|uniref:hypothetical protein n=1 Tax=Nocardia sp. NPDC050408 TaxID=3364319 RepID=UPI0037898E45
MAVVIAAQHPPSESTAHESNSPTTPLAESGVRLWSVMERRRNNMAESDPHRQYNVAHRL